MGTQSTKEVLDALAIIGFTRSEYSTMIEVLKERMLALPLEINGWGGWYCDLCGSTNIQGTAWIYLNEPDREVGGEPPDDDTFCDDCQSHDTGRHHVHERPLFCACLAEAEDGSEVPQASWPDDVGNAKGCSECGQRYTITRPEKAEVRAALKEPK